MAPSLVAYASQASSSSASEHTLHDDHPTASESTPLLASPKPASSSSSVSSSSSSPQGDTQQDERPFPTMQILLLCFARLMEPIAFFAVFPFIAQMVKRNADLPDSDIGFYSGLIESLFSAVQVLVLIFWGRLADAVGRKPVILITLAGMTAGTMGYTLARSLGGMILWRCVAGVFSGSNLVLRTAVSDHCSRETQALAYSWFSFAGNVGIMVGPMLGGALADPVEQYPGVFGRSAFFARYPYALVGFMLTGVSVVGIVVSAIFLEETLPGTRPEGHDRKSMSASSSTCLVRDEGHGGAGGGAGEGAGAGAGEDPAVLAKQLQQQLAQQPSIRELLKAPGVAVVIWVYTHFLLLAFAFTAILPVALFTPVAIGGTGFSPFQISLYMALQGLSQALWLLLVFPLAQRRLGTNGVLRACADAYPFFLGSFVLLNMLLRASDANGGGAEGGGAGGMRTAAWVVGLAGAVVGPGVSMAFTGIQLAVNDVSPNAHVMATLNAVAMTSASAVRSFVPGLATAVYAVGVRNQTLGGHLAWCVLIPISMALRVFLKHMPGEK